MPDSSGLDTRYRTLPDDVIETLIYTNLTQINNIKSVGQSIGIGGRNNTLADLKTLQDDLINLYSAKAWKSANPGTTGLENFGYQNQDYTANTGYNYDFF